MCNKEMKFFVLRPSPNRVTTVTPPAYVIDVKRFVIDPFISYPGCAGSNPTYDGYPCWG